jgi:hypothetical protein
MNDQEQKNLYEILVPTQYGYPKTTPIRTKHHKEWDKRVQKITGGLTILSPGKGKWTYQGLRRLFLFVSCAQLNKYNRSLA